MKRIIYLLILFFITVNITPYTITYDNATSTNGSATSFSFSHTIGAGNNRELILAIQIYSGTVYVTGATYAGYPMTKICSNVQGSGATGTTEELWSFYNYPAGTNTVAVTLSGFASASLGVTSYFQVDSIGGFTGTSQASVTYLSNTLTTVANNSWIVGGFGQRSAAAVFTPGTGITSRWTQSNTGIQKVSYWDKVVTTPGSYLSFYNSNTSANSLLEAVEMKVVPSPTPTVTPTVTQTVTPTVTQTITETQTGTITPTPGTVSWSSEYFIQKSVTVAETSGIHHINWDRQSTWPFTSTTDYTIHLQPLLLGADIRYSPINFTAQSFDLQITDYAGVTRDCSTDSSSFDVFIFYKLRILPTPTP